MQYEPTTNLPAVRESVPPARPQDAPVKTKAQRVAEDFLCSYPNINTRKNYEQGLIAWFTFCAKLGMDPLTGFDDEGVRRADVEKFLLYSEQIEGKARRTVAHRFSAIRGFYRRAMMDAVIDRDPTMYVRAPKVQRITSTNDLTRNELSAMLKAAKAKSKRDYAIFCLLGFNGLRVGELVGLDIEHVNRSNAFWLITITRKGGNVQTLSLSQDTAWAVNEHIGDRLGGPLFCSSRTPGKRLGRGDVQRLVKVYGAGVGITKRISPHSFRHAFVTLSLTAGVSAREVQKAAGHADGRMVAYYDHGNANRAREATHLLSAFVNDIME